MTDIQNRCRTCLDSGSNHVSVLGDPTVYLHIKSCLSINILSNDDLPKKICSSCVLQLREFYNFQLNAKCSQDWLESVVNEKKRSSELKIQQIQTVQPLPDSEYNSDSLLEFLNNTANIEDYLNNLGKDDIPSIVNMLDRTAEASGNQKAKSSPKKKENQKPTCLNMDVDVLDSDKEIVQEILMKETEPKRVTLNNEDKLTCFGCKDLIENVKELSQHFSICDMALRTCIHCDILFDSKSRLKQHSLTHSAISPLTCNCGKTFKTRELFLQHNITCNIDHIASMGYVHRCKECGETFQERFQLYRHAKKHILAAQKRICDICGHSFIGEEELARHKKENHNNLTGHLYKCKICSLTGTDRKEIYLHIQRHLDIKQLDRHLCEHCGRCFSTRATLLRHSLQHTTTQVHRCSLCNTTFKNKQSRDQHLLGHTEIVMCDKCGLSVLSNKLGTHTCV